MSHFAVRASHFARMVQLQLPEGSTEKEYDVGCSWMELAVKQQQSDFGEINIDDAADGDCFAMDIRKSLDEDFSRRVFVLLDDDMGKALIFDEDGRAPAAEPDAQLPLRDAEDNFIDAWAGGYYRIAEVGASDDDDQGRELPVTGTLHSDGKAPLGTRLTMLFEAPDGTRKRCVAHCHDNRYRHPPSHVCTPLRRSGCIVGPDTDDGGLILGFDDGAILQFQASDMAAAAEIGTVEYDTYDGEGDIGLIEGERGFAAAELFTYNKGKPVGLLLGKFDCAFDEPIYMSHHVMPMEPRARKSARLTHGDRLGLHTFSMREHVVYTAGQTDEDAVEAVVIGVISKAKDGSEQARKFLVLYEVETEIVFLSSFTQWRRVSEDPKSEIDPDSPDFRAKLVDKDYVVRIWNGSNKLAHIKNITDATNYIRKAPPTVQQQQKERTKKERAEEQARKEAEKKARQQGGKPQRGGRGARGRGSGSGSGSGSGRGRGNTLPHDPPPSPLRDPPSSHNSPLPRRSPRQHPSPSPPGSVKALKKSLRVLKAAQAYEGTAQRAGEIEGVQTDLEERERKYRKYGRW